MKTFPACDVAMPRVFMLELWYIRGFDHCYWPTKVVAEAMARVHFPDEDADTRYARIGFRTFHLED